MRSIKLIVVHCSAVRPGQQSSAEDINTWHRNKGWKGIGYHYVVRRDGTVELRYSIGVCYEGGLDEAGKAADTRTPEQKRVLRKLLEELHQRFPEAVIVGHRDLTHDRECPCFDAVREYQELQPPDG